MPPQTYHRRALERIGNEFTRIAVTKGPDAGASLEAAQGTLRIGTAQDNDLVLTDATVSPRHCELAIDDTGFRLRDLGSTHGVRRGALRVYDVLSTEPLELALGKTTLAITPFIRSAGLELFANGRFGNLVGNSQAMRELFGHLQRLALSPLSVLIQGETGTGKDLVAESLHDHGARAAGPFVVFDCSAVAPTLVESELFGHERGAFTGAVTARPGVFEQAHGGTLFLDEIGELPKALQPKLLRVLERREVKRLGSQCVKTLDVRVVAATNRDLAAEVRAGNFREDLYYRLAGACIHVPPLRERKQDIPALLQHFLTLEAATALSADSLARTLERFHAHRWPGNVRELRNAVQRLAVEPELELGPQLWPASVRALSSPLSTATPQALEPLRIARQQALQTFERGYLRALLGVTQGNVSRAASIAEVSRQLLHKLIRKHGDCGPLNPLALLPSYSTTHQQDS